MVKGKIHFPDPRSASDDGLLCFGGDLEVSTLLEAYGQGIFPWPQEGLPMLWFSPLNRGILELGEMRWPKRFLRSMKDRSFRVTFNQAFSQVIQECASVPRSHESGTWILPEMQKAYLRFHDAGYAQSVECWRGTELVGGLYGVYVGGVFSGESMFYRASDASKRCLFALTERLREKGLGWMDIQMVTPILERLGGKLITREEFLMRVSKAHLQHPKQLDLSGEFVWPSK